MKTMKNFKVLFLLLTFSAVLQSCSSEEVAPNAQKSSALRIYLKEMKSAFNISSRNTNVDSNICFEFIYPITLSYNDGTTVTVLNEEQLISILENETSDLYLDGIVFPFDILVSGNNNPVTINDEQAFWNVIENCDMGSYEDSIRENNCFAYEYPFSLITNNNQTVVITSENALLDLINGFNNDYFIIDFVYPFSVTINNEIIQIQNAFEYEELIENCFFSDCNCNEVYEPVCVNIGSETIQFPNACAAECAGYTPNDFVDCNMNNEDSFEYILENCLNISYPVQVQFNGNINTAVNNEELLQLFNPSLNQIPDFIYPITVSFESLPNETFTIYNQNSMIELLIELDCN